MDTRQLEQILMIEKEKSLTRAAEKLYISQPALTQSLNRLEDSLGFSIFRRNEGGFLPTKEGAIYLEKAGQMVRVKRDTYKKISDLNRRIINHLSIAVNRQTGSIFISKLLPRFHRDYPQVMLDIAEADSNEAKRLLTEGEIDMALMCTTSLKSTLLNLSSLYLEEMMLILPPDHPANHGAGKSLSLSNLADSPFILYRKETNFRQMIDQVLDRHLVKPNILCEINNFFAVANLVAQGAGISFMPREMIRHHTGYRAYSINPPEYYHIALGIHKSIRPNEAMQYLMRLMEEAAAQMGYHETT